MSKATLARIRLMTEGDLEIVRLWRNHPEVRRYMYSKHGISPEEHAHWFARAAHDPRRHLLIFEINQTSCGFLQINHNSTNGIATWGFYAAPDAPKGSGRTLGEIGLTYAFEKLGLHKLCAEVLAFNERSISFHLSLGFQREGVLHQQHFDGEHYHDVVCFGLLASDWSPPM